MYWRSCIANSSQALQSQSDIPIAPAGSWDSLHVFECHERGRSAKYKLTSTVMLVLKTATLAKADNKGLEGTEGKGGVNLSGSMTRQVIYASEASISMGANCGDRLRSTTP